MNLVTQPFLEKTLCYNLFSLVAQSFYLDLRMVWMTWTTFSTAASVASLSTIQWNTNLTCKLINLIIFKILKQKRQMDCCERDRKH
jgi:hypothetical protein